MRMRQAWGIASAVLLFAAGAHAGTKTWSPHVIPSYWSNPANWSDGILPGPGDHVVFPAALTPSGIYTWSLSNDVVGVVVDSIEVGQGGAIINGNSITLTGTNPLTAATSPSQYKLQMIVPLVVTNPNATMNLDTNTILSRLTMSGGTLTISAPNVSVTLQASDETSPSSINAYASVWSGYAGTTGFSFAGGTFKASVVGTSTAPVTVSAQNVTLFGNTTRTVNLVPFNGHNTELTLPYPDYRAPLNLIGGTVDFVAGSYLYESLGGTGHLNILDANVFLYNASNTLSGGITVTKQGGLYTTGNSFELPPSAITVDGGLLDIDIYSENIPSIQCINGGTISYYIYNGNVTHLSQGLTLNNCILKVDGSFASSDPVTLFTIDSSSPVSGTFNNLPEGAPIGINNQTRYISYRGGSGNDVVLYSTPGGAPGSATSRNLRIDLSTIPITIGTSQYFDVYVTDGTGAPVAGETIKLETNCIPTAACVTVDPPGTAVSDSKGRAEFVTRAITGAGSVGVKASDITSGSNAAPVSALFYVVALAINTPAVKQVQNMWWAGTSENGWGLSLIQHDDRLFGALYIYDAAGNPTWVVMSGGTWDSSHTIFTGPLYEPTGSPFYAYDTTKFNVGDLKGYLTATFQDSNHAKFEYNVGSLNGGKTIAREDFGASSIVGTDHTDLWWGGDSQNGWGITITQQGSTLFPVWFTYGTSGAPLWYFMTDGTWNAANDTYSGNMYRATGSSWIGTTYDASKLAVTKAGTFSILFTASGATFSYNADGHSGSAALVREPF